MCMWRSSELDVRCRGSAFLVPPVRPRIPLANCIQAWAATESIEGFFSTAINDTCLAEKSVSQSSDVSIYTVHVVFIIVILVLFRKTSLSSFPDFLMIQLKKFTISDDWVPKKLGKIGVLLASSAQAYTAWNMICRNRSSKGPFSGKRPLSTFSHLPAKRPLGVCKSGYGIYCDADVEVEMTDVLDLSSLRGHGLQTGEEELPEGGPPAPGWALPHQLLYEHFSHRWICASEVVIDDATVRSLADMGFPFEACRKAVFHTKNSGVEPAMNWVMDHMSDPGILLHIKSFSIFQLTHYTWVHAYVNVNSLDFAAPLVLSASTASKPSGFTANEEGVAMIQSMGFTRDQAVKALKANVMTFNIRFMKCDALMMLWRHPFQDNNVEAAVNWIFSNPDQLNEPMETEATTSGGDGDSQTERYRDGTSSEYWQLSPMVLLAMYEDTIPFRIPTGGLHQPHGNIHDGRSLRVPSAQGRQVGDFQRWEGCFVGESAQKPRISLLVRAPPSAIAMQRYHEFYGYVVLHFLLFFMFPGKTSSISVKIFLLQSEINIYLLSVKKLTHELRNYRYNKVN